jgi:hypothetical protein
MNGKYLATNLEPLKAIGSGKVLEAIDALINERNDHRVPSAKGDLVAYEIQDIGGRIVIINFLIENQNGLSFRKFEYYMQSENVEDCLMGAAEYSFGIHYSVMEDFFKLRGFYVDSVI